MDKITELKCELKGLVDEYQKMTNSGIKLELKMNILNKIGMLEQTKDELFMNAVDSLNNEKTKMFDFFDYCETMKYRHLDLSFEKDFFFDNLLLILNQEKNDFERFDLKLYQHNIMIAGTTNLINQFKEIGKLIDIINEFSDRDKFVFTTNGSIFYAFAYNQIKQEKDLIICSDDFFPHEFTFNIGIEMRDIDICDSAECCYFKGMHSAQIDYAIDLIEETAKEYGVDFNQSVLEKRLIKKG